MNLPLISLIVPVYNVELYLRTCLDSIIAQTYLNLEIILVDDGSPDNSGSICENYALQDSRIKVIHKINGGLSDARNVGLDIANGEFIGFVDSDDILHPQFIEILYQNLRDADIVFCDILPFYKSETIIFNPVNDIDVLEFSSNELLQQIISFRSPSVVIAPNKLYRRSVWQGIRYPLGKIHEDEFVIHQLLSESYKIIFIDVAMYHYRKRMDGIMGNAALRKPLLDGLEAYQLRKIFFEQHKMYTAAEELDRMILAKCVLPSIPRSHPAWKGINWQRLLKRKDVKGFTKAILYLKKYVPVLYSGIYRGFHFINKQKS